MSDCRRMCGNCCLQRYGRCRWASWLFFIYDSSPDQRRTRKLIDGSIDLAMRLLTVVKSALFKPVRGRLLSLLRDVDLLPVYNFAPAYQNAEETI